MTSISTGMAEWIADTSIDRLPPEVRLNATLRVLDIIGVMLASRDHAVTRAARNAVAESDPGTGASTLGSRAPMTPAGAAFVNGVMSSVLEFDDTWLPSTIHATGSSLAPLLPFCMTGVPGSRVIEAVTLASETMIRLAMVTPRHDWFEHAMHSTSIFSVFGGVAGLARLRALTPAQTVDAFGAAGSMSAGITASFEDGTSTKTMHVGLGSANAVRAVALARAGISGPAPVFEGRFGWFNAHVQTSADRQYRHVREDLGREWQVLDLASKQYPVAYPLMPQIEAALRLHHDHRIPPEEIREIDAWMAPRHMKTLCEPPEEKIRPLTTWHARISLPHVIAEALVTGRTDKNAYSEANINDPRINAVAAKVRSISDAEAGKDYSRSGARITMRLHDGREFTCDIPDMRGTAANPITTDDYLAKFRANVDDVLPGDVVERTADDLLRLEQIEDIGPVLDRLCAERP